MSKQLPFEVSRLAARMTTHGALHNQLEPHNLRTLAARLLLSRREVLDHITAGRLLPVSGPLNGRFDFPAAHLDALRNGVVGFIARTICAELSRRGCDADLQALAVSRAFERQHELARSVGENLVELAQSDDDDDSFIGSAKRAAGTIAGTAAAGAAGYGAYKGYRYLKNRRGANGTPQLPGGPTPDDDFTAKSPNGGSGGGSAVPAAPTVSTAATDAADHDLLSTAIKTGQRAVASIGGAIRGAVKFFPR